MLLIRLLRDGWKWFSADGSFVPGALQAEVVVADKTPFLKAMEFNPNVKLPKGLLVGIANSKPYLVKS
jgi:hypothetical protein